MAELLFFSEYLTCHKLIVLRRVSFQFRDQSDQKNNSFWSRQLNNNIQKLNKSGKTCLVAISAWLIGNLPLEILMLSIRYKFFGKDLTSSLFFIFFGQPFSYKCFIVVVNFMINFVFSKVKVKKVRSESSRQVFTLVIFLISFYLRKYMM